ncbi:hypothetical protein KFZ70_05550 [Tamlana fucoidanivorans]|uniref:Uncharacterized protein n=1 Tax=Allotamlana fucoidanivorans TaxID=2583814 RepID=A0A5C4SSR1_9FLAO|nr:DUF5687 family protein [Tamlana fucoidanivorans]TNJ47027.1 hypothetical protein FGF67_00425 [Tamlana fucoidanivorans]
MIKHFISLEWKAFFRSPSLKTNLFFKILLGFGALWMIVTFLLLGFGVFFIIRDKFHKDPIVVFNDFLVFYVVFDLVFRYFLQKMPIVNIRPLLYLPIKKAKVIHFALNKTMLSFFNIVHAFLFIPFSVVLLIEGYPIFSVLGWFMAIMALVFCNNFINVFVNSKDVVFYAVLGVIIVFGLLLYYELFDVTLFTAPVFQSFYDVPYLALTPFIVLVLLYKIAFKYFRNHFYLDGGLSKKIEVVKSEDFAWLNRFGSVSTFLKNDIRLLKRNKRSKTTLLMSALFLFYGLMFFTNSIEAYKGPFWRIFAGIFVSGGFLFSFGQFVPSWDSAYYPLMMSQNIRYKAYISSKWYLMVIATIISTILSVFYLYFGWQAYAAILVGAIYNIGVNSHIVLWGGAYIKTPIDLTSNRKAFGDKKAFNAKTLLLTLPKLVLPMVLYAIGHFTLGETFGFALVAICGVAGFLFKNKVFNVIEKVYKSEKYKTLAAYKQNN